MKPKLNLTLAGALWLTGIFVSPQVQAAVLDDRLAELNTCLEAADDSLRPAGNKVDLAPVQLNKKHGYMNSQGFIAIPPCFDLAEPFSQSGIARIGIWEDKSIYKAVYGYINTHGKIVVVPQFDFDRSGQFTVEGLAFARSPDGKWGYLDVQGKWAISPQYVSVSPFSYGLAAAQVESGQTGYINTKGEMVIKLKFESAATFSANGLAAVEINKKWGAIDRTGKIVIPPQFEGRKGFQFYGGLAVLKFEDDKYGYIDKEGKTVIKPQFKRAGEFSSHGVAPVKVDSKWGLIDLKGEFVVEPQFSKVYDVDADARDFDLYAVKLKRRWGWINSKGKWVINPQYREIDDDGFGANGLAKVTDEDGNKFFIDTRGNRVVNFAESCGTEVIRNPKGELVWPSKARLDALCGK